MKILHICPSNYMTGGTESIHKFVSTLKACGADAKILYIGGNAFTDPQPQPYREAYHCDYVRELPQDYDGFVIFPEIYANSVTEYKYKNCKKAVLWLSVDNYKNFLGSKADEGMFRFEPNTIHLSQSLYADEYLGGLGVATTYRVADVINDEFFKEYKEETRSNVVLYNPSKMTQFGEQLISQGKQYRGLQFEPLKGLTIPQMAETLRHHKLYIDFGWFPGRERIPREAVMCGCCIITGKLGASYYYRDVSIQQDYKFDADQSNIPRILNKMEYVLSNYESLKTDFDAYRASIIQDRDQFESQCRKVIEVFENAF